MGVGHTPPPADVDGLYCTCARPESLAIIAKTQHVQVKRVTQKVCFLICWRRVSIFSKIFKKWVLKRIIYCIFYMQKVYSKKRKLNISKYIYLKRIIHVWSLKQVKRAIFDEIFTKLIEIFKSYYVCLFCSFLCTFCAFSLSL